MDQGEGDEVGVALHPEEQQQARALAAAGDLREAASSRAAAAGRVSVNRP